jgi:Na+/H+-dicarboxylate symporter
VKAPSLGIRILLAVVLGAVVGGLLGKDALGGDAYALFGFVGKLFLQALSMLVVPLVFTSMVTGMAGIAREQDFARLGGMTLLYMLLTTSIAVIIAVALVNLIQPGQINGVPVKDLIGLPPADSALAKIEGRSAGDFSDLFLQMFPANLIAAASAGQILGLIVFGLLYGFFAARLPEALAKPQLDFWQGAYETLIAITQFVLRFAPIGVFALVAKVAAETGLAAIEPIFWFFVSVLAGLLLHMLIILPTIAWFGAGVPPRKLFAHFSPALLMAFSTASSAATLPVNLDCAENRAGVTARIARFVLPLGATVNMNGTALYECSAVLFIAQAYGLELSLAQQVTVVVLSVMTAVGVAAIPAASLVAIVLILGSLGLPPEALGLILAVDRLLDMARTTVNVFGDSTGSLLINRQAARRPVPVPPAPSAT